MKGFAGKGEYAQGAIHGTLHIEGETHTVQFHIVPDEWIPEDILLGRDFLQMVEVTIIRGIPTISKITQRPKECEIFHIEITNEVEPVSEWKCVQDVKPEHRTELVRMITNYSPKRVEKSAIQMELQLTDSVPVYQRARRLPAVERNIVQGIVDDWITDGIAKPSKSEYASPILLRPKKNGTWRLCVDYRQLNKKIIKDRYPLPIMEDVIDALQGYQVFSTIDLKNGLFHVDMEKGSQNYTSFITPDGQYEFTRAPFGLCNSPAVFQRFINSILQEARQQNILELYLDDVVIPSHTEQENLEKLQKFFKIAEVNELLIYFQKCTFLQREINFLGFVITKNEVKPSMEKTRAVQDFPKPTQVKGVQSFLGLTGFFRKFIDQYAQKAKPLSQLLRKDTPFKFGDIERAAFQELKDELCQRPVLRMYNPKAYTEIHTDASARGFGGCMLQRQADDNKMHPIYFLSFRTTPAQEKWHSYVLETYAVVKALERLRVYVLGIPVLVYTDCHAFQQTMMKKNTVAKIARWALSLEEYDIEVKHRPGKSMQHVDALSRNAVLIVEDGILEMVRKAQETDDECKVITELLQKGPHKCYTQRNGIIYKFHEGNYLLKIPKLMINNILAKIHGPSHLSRKRMEIAIQQNYEVTDAAKRVDKFISNCVTCILATKKRGKREGFLNPIDKHDEPLHTYHIDHVGPMETTSKRYAHILVVVDAFTKFTWLYPTKSTGSTETISKLEQQKTTFANPARIIADKGAAFIAKEFEDYCNAERIQLHLTTTATPRGNGQVERINAVVKETTTKLALHSPKNWYKHVARVQLCINAAVSRSTSFTPFQLMFGVPAKTPADEELIKVIEEEIMSDFVALRAAKRTEAAANILKTQLVNTKQFNKNRKQAHLYVLGDMVAIDRVKKEKGGKFLSQMLGPYEVTRVMRNHRYEVRKIGFGDGPINTSVPADRMRQWANGLDDSDNE